MRYLRPGHSWARRLGGRITHNRHGALSDRLVDELVSVAGLAPHGNECIAWPQPPRVVFQPIHARITALGEDFRAVQKLEEIHEDSIVSLLQFNIVSGTISCHHGETARTRRPGLRKLFHLPNFTVTRDPVAACDPAAGDCSRARPLPTASRSRPLSSASSMAPRTLLPAKEGTKTPLCSTSSTTVPLDRR